MPVSRGAGLSVQFVGAVECPPPQLSRTIRAKRVGTASSPRHIFRWGEESKSTEHTIARSRLFFFLKKYTTHIYLSISIHAYKGRDGCRTGSGGKFTGVTAAEGLGEKEKKYFLIPSPHLF